MTLVDLIHFYMGDAEVIRRLAGNPWTLVIGAILVFSAGLARHCDTHDLARQSWRLLIPFLAATLASGLLFLVIVLIRGLEGAWALGLGILALFWLTGPLAWLYGLPFERFASASRAAFARRCALGVVAIGRVLLMSWCVGALTGYPWWASLAIVFCFAIPMALLAIGTALIFLQRPEATPMGRSTQTQESAFVQSALRVADHMGAVNLDDNPVHEPAEPHSVQPADTSAEGAGLGCLAVILLGASSLILANVIAKIEVEPWQPIIANAPPPSPAVWAFTALAVLFWTGWLFYRQPAHRRRTRFVERLRYGSLPETMRDLAELWPADFPPQWNPASALTLHEFAPRLLEASIQAANLPEGSWVRVAFLDILAPMLPIWMNPLNVWLLQNDRMSEDQLRDLARLRDLLCALPEGQNLLLRYQDYLADLYTYTRERDPPRCQLLEDLLALALRRDKPR